MKITRTQNLMAAALAGVLAVVTTVAQAADALSSWNDGPAKGGTVSLFVDGNKDGEGRVEQTVPMVFSADETCDIGKEFGSPVSPDYGPKGNELSGQVNWVQIALEKDDHDHLIPPDERFKIAMARQ